MSRLSRSSALYWFPLVELAGLPVPRTRVVTLDLKDWMPTLDGKPGGPSYELTMEGLMAASASIGYPVFVRSDLSSAKHDGPVAYRARDEKEVRRCAYMTFEDNLLKKDLWPRAFLVREWLELDGAFKAFGWRGAVDGLEDPGHLVAREWRYFVDDLDDSGVLCRHFYWPADAIHFPSRRTGRTRPDGLPEVESSGPADWRERLEALRLPAPPEEVATLALRAVEACHGGAWSVDFARTADGRWVLVDMALAEESWHEAACPKGPKEVVSLVKEAGEEEG